MNVNSSVICEIENLYKNNVKGILNCVFCICYSLSRKDSQP